MSIYVYDMYIDDHRCTTIRMPTNTTMLMHIQKYLQCFFFLDGNDTSQANRTQTEKTNLANRKRITSVFWSRETPKPGQSQLGCLAGPGIISRWVPDTHRVWRVPLGGFSRCSLEHGVFRRCIESLKYCSSPLPLQPWVSTYIDQFGSIVLRKRWDGQLTKDSHRMAMAPYEWLQKWMDEYPN